ncbi:hypothetical protein D3C83_61820 [compost metagenome]
MPICPPFARWRFAVEKTMRRPAELMNARFVMSNAITFALSAVIAFSSCDAVSLSSDPVSATRAVPGLGSLMSMSSGIWGAPRAVPYSQA